MPQTSLANPFIQNAVLYPVPLNSQKAYTCAPVANGYKPSYVSMNINFSQNLSWLIDLNQGAPQPPLDHISCIYCDASFSFHDVYFFFPDSGQGINIPTGNAQLFPVIAGTPIPKF